MFVGFVRSGSEANRDTSRPGYTSRFATACRDLLTASDPPEQAVPASSRAAAAMPDRKRRVTHVKALRVSWTTRPTSTIARSEGGSRAGCGAETPARSDLGLARTSDRFGVPCGVATTFWSVTATRLKAGRLAFVAHPASGTPLRGAWLSNAVPGLSPPLSEAGSAVLSSIPARGSAIAPCRVSGTPNGLVGSLAKPAI